MSVCLFPLSQSELAEKQQRRESEILDLADDDEFQELIGSDNDRASPHDSLSQSHNDDDLMLELEEYISTS